jgi:hypothetical protein
VKDALAGRNPKDIVQVAGFVPRECLQWPVRRICGECAFAGARFASFDFDVSLAELGEGAFAGSSLETVTLPESIAKVGAGCFRDCKFLREVSLVSKIRVLAQRLFEGCELLAAVKVPPGIQQIGYRAFEGTSSLRSFDFACLGPDATVGSSVFDDSSLETVTLPDTIAEVGEGCFRDCKCLREVSLGSKIRVVADTLFQGCESLAVVKVPPGIERIGIFAFAETSSLRSLDLAHLSPLADLG